ncbi:hypothetical protein BCV70DRAFT_202671 [Testicularia cyperi]|uniref:Uncharacterized protein n=1 Tax=Testicularia cyperi TaxID=1882483 RepID=A0A317XJZ7_9BASI|nr:hypothetical protein BCV70DRAFT_202671 [Testicularia cyperi]
MTEFLFFANRAYSDDAVNGFFTNQVAGLQESMAVFQEFRRRYPDLSQDSALIKPGDHFHLSYEYLRTWYDRQDRHFRVFVYPEPILSHGFANHAPMPFFYNGMAISVKFASRMTSDLRKWQEHWPNLNPWYQDQIIYAILGTRIASTTQPFGRVQGEVKLVRGSTRILAIITQPKEIGNRLSRIYGLNVGIPEEEQKPGWVRPSVWRHLSKNWPKRQGGSQPPSS